ncbi:glycosyltransferase family 2 protein [Nodularia chucula]|uniref:glycosyltransferase family 2 protein n=1 Tax=Nodularia chucula TaxID=3093667 RepID=UPI0039C5F7F2
MAPLVSFILPCFNRAIYLEKCVTSILNQTLSNLECLIIDDGSTDSTREIAEKLIKKDARVKYFYQDNGGVSSARNWGLNLAQGEWIHLLDPDDWILEDKIEFQLNYLHNFPTKEVVLYGDYERVHLDAQQNIIKRDVNLVSSLTKEQLIQRLLLPDFLANSPFPLIHLLMHKSVVQNQRFDESLKALEDRDFMLNLLLAGVDFIYTPIVGTFYTKHQSNTTNNWSAMKIHYTKFYENLTTKNINLLAFSQQGIDYFIKEALKEKDDKNFYRLVKILPYPITLFHPRISIKSMLLWKIIYQIRLIIPNFILYEKYRGPRSKKIIAMFSQILNFAGNN